MNKKKVKKKNKVALLKKEEVKWVLAIHLCLIKQNIRRLLKKKVILLFFFFEKEFIFYYYLQ